MHGSYGTGYRAPSFFERFGAIPSFGFFGDPNLKAEKSKGWDLGVEWSPSDSFVADVTYFDNKIKNLIDQFSIYMRYLFLFSFFSAFFSAFSILLK